MNIDAEYQTKEQLKKNIDRLILRVQENNGMSNSMIIEMLEELINLYKN